MAGVAHEPTPWKREAEGLWLEEVEVGGEGRTLGVACCGSEEQLVVLPDRMRTDKGAGIVLNAKIKKTETRHALRKPHRSGPFIAPPRAL